MIRKLSDFATRTLLGICGLVAAAYSVPAAVLNGLANGGPGVKGYITGAQWLEW